MGLLAPAFLLGLLGIALPLWLHRLQTQSSERQPFGSAMLLETTEQRVHVQRKLKYLLLLALRIALLCLLALGFAQPFLSNDRLAGADAAAGTQLIVIDTSASMQRAGALEQAQSLANDILDVAPAGSVLQLVAAADEIRPMAEMSTDAAAQRDALRSLRAGWGRLDFGELSTAVDALATELPAPVRLHLVSDLQQSAMPARFADLAMQHVASFTAHRVLPRVAGDMHDARIESLREHAGVVDVSVGNAAGRTLTLWLNDELVGSHDIESDELLHFDAVAAIDGENRLEARFSDADYYAADDRRFAAFARGRQQAVPVLTADTHALPFTYLSTALNAGSDVEFRAEPMPATAFDPRLLSRFRFAIVDDLGALSAAQEAALDTWLDNGGALLAFAGRRSTARETLPLTGHRIAGAQLSAREALAVGRVDTRHPVLAATDGWFVPKFSDALPLQLRADDEILVALENDTALLIETRHGNGKVLLLSAGLENLGNDFPIRPVFVGFMLEAARYLSGTAGITRQYVAGERLRLPDGGQVLDPRGDALLSLQGTTAAQSVRLAEPGVYQVLSPGLDYLAAVNPDVRESRFETLSDELLADWAGLMRGGDSAEGSAADDAAAGIIELWPWALLLLVMIIIAESLLADLLVGPQQRQLQGASA